jgi:hypothetical protein
MRKLAAMTDADVAVPDPRVFPVAGSAAPAAARLHALARASLDADTGPRAAALDRELRVELGRCLDGDGAALAALFDSAPSVAIARHLWRQLDGAWRELTLDPVAGLAVTVFALPLVVVTGLETTSGDTTLPAVLAAPQQLAGILQQHGALSGNKTFALADALVAAEAIDIPRLPELLAWQRLPDIEASGAALPMRALAPAPLTLAPGREGVHLRFLVGWGVAKPGADLLADAEVGAWGLPLARELSRQLAIPGASVLALPRAPNRPLPAVWQGRVAQREVGAQIFASNAIRKLRASVGEPVAVISAHRTSDVPEGGELRLSLSSPFAPRDAQGFRCPLHPLDRIGDVVTMLTRLLADCRVTDIRVLGGVHPDRDPATGAPLLFKPDTIPAAATIVVH